MSETPRYVLGAVQAFLEGKREPLINMFQNGIPLHEYPESRELLEKLMRGKAIRKLGRPANRARLTKQARNIAIRNEVAQLREAYPDLQIYSGVSTAPSACSLVAPGYKLTPKQVYNIFKEAPE